MPIRALEMCVTFPMQHMIDQFHQFGTIFNIISKSLVFGIVGYIAIHNALICVF
jgi:hypothetical protein